MEAFQLIPFDLGSQAWVAGNALTFSFQNLMPMIGMGIAHTCFIDMELQLTPTYTTAPTLQGLNAAISNLEIFDGLRQWTPQGGSFNMLRAFTRLENGRIILPDSVTNGASAGLRTIRQRFFFGDPMLYGMPSDSAMPNALLGQGGYARLTGSALTAISADTTVATGTVTLTAWQALYYNKIIFPAWYERQMQAVTSGQQFNQRALYAALGLVKSNLFAAFSAGDIGDVTINTGTALPISAITSARLTAGHNADFRVGQLDGVIGDPRSATLDINARTMNGLTPTALTNSPIDLQPILWTPQDCRQTKLTNVPATLTLNFSGSATPQALLGRYRPLTPTERGLQLTTAMQRLPGRIVKDFGARLADDTSQYNGPLLDFLPYQARLNNLPY